MPTYRFPVLVWEDFEGCFTAALVEDASAPAAVAREADDALFQLKEYLEWAYKEQPWRAGPDLLDAQLMHFKVEVRPEYRVEQRIYPCDEPLALRVACVHGRQAGGLLVASLPLIGAQFYYHGGQSLKELVAHYVRERLKGLAPRDLSRFLPPKSVALEEIVLHVREAERRFRYTPAHATLAKVAEPLGEKSLRKQFSRAWEREREVNDLVKRLGEERANVIIVGEPGVGKTAVMVEAVRNVERQLKEAADKDDDEQFTHKFWLTSGARLIAGMQYLGEWQERCEKVIEELSGVGGVLCVGNLLDLVKTGGGAGESIATFFLPYLQRGELRMVTEATPAELDACRRLLPGFVDLFQMLPLPQFDRQQALSVLARVAADRSRNLKLEIAEGVTATVYHLFRRFQPYQSFPGRTVAFLGGLCERAVRDGWPRVEAGDAVAEFTRQTGLPELFLRDELRLAREEVLMSLREQVVGQSEACEIAANLVTTFKAGLNDPQRPLGVLLFCGPTGVGKTELAKAFARFLFGQGERREGHKDERLVRLDMSEYAGWGSAERLVAGADGEPSALIQKMREQPFSVVLLDEIEKADAEVFDVLLSVFDEGRLTDRYGRVTIFRSSIIVMTSNLGADKLGAVGFGKPSAPSYSAEAMQFFRPEFYNRIDAVVRFSPLAPETIREITRKELRAVGEREGLASAGVKLEWSEELVEYLAREGFDARYGARPLQRTIEALVVAPLARFLVAPPNLNGKTLRAKLGAGGQVVFDCF
jgi:ATP-dependent Clp protease ATP-binding subunit ClpC